VIGAAQLLRAADERAIFSARRPSRLGSLPSVAAARRLQIAPPSKAFVGAAAAAPHSSASGSPLAADATNVSQTN